MSERSIRQRIIGGIGAQAFAQILQAIVRLAEVPAFLAIWDARRYGEWLLIAAIPTYLSLADGGFATTSGREMTMRLSAGDRQGALRVFQSSWSLLLGIAIGTLTLVTLLLLATPLMDWIVPAEYAGRDVKLALVLLSAYVLAGFMTGLCYGVFCAEQRYDLGSWISSSFLLIELLASLAGAAFFSTLSAAAAGLLISRLVLIAINWSVLRRVAPWCKFGFRHASAEVLRILAVPALGSLAIPLGMAGNISGMRILVGAVLGPTAVPYFAAMRTLARTGQMPTLLIIRILEPELAISYGQGRLDIFRALLRRSAQIATWSGFVVAVGVLVVSQFLFPLWVHYRFALDVPTLLLLLAASALNGVWYTMLQAAYATNRTHAIALPFILIYGLACILLGWLFMLWIGITGAGLSLFIVELAMCAVTIPQALRLSGESFSTLMETMLRPPFKDLVRLLKKR